jgi:hypothetical protein
MQEAESAVESSYRDFLRGTQGDRIVTILQAQQYLCPHQPLKDAISAARAEAGFCQRAGEQALAVLHLDPQRKIGRLKSSELVQLARTIHRFWQQPHVSGESCVLNANK